MDGFTWVMMLSTECFSNTCGLGQAALAELSSACSALVVNVMEQQSKVVMVINQKVYSFQWDLGLRSLAVSGKFQFKNLGI